MILPLTPAPLVIPPVMVIPENEHQRNKHNSGKNEVEHRKAGFCKGSEKRREEVNKNGFAQNPVVCASEL
jgi:hypothetical protein